MDKFLRQDNVYLVLVGDGEPLFSQLKTYVNDLGLSAKILFTGRRNDIPNVLAGFDLFALATEQEASGTVFVEASAAGLPVIGTDVGGVSEMFTDGVSGVKLAIDRFMTEGWPTPKMEAWHHTSLSPLAAAQFSAGNAQSVSAQIAALKAQNSGYWLVFVDGAYDARNKLILIRWCHE